MHPPRFSALLHLAVWAGTNYWYFFTIKVKIAMVVGPIKTHKEIPLRKIYIIDKYPRLTVRQQREV